MKILLPLLLIIVCTVGAFGQARKPSPKPKIRPLLVNKGINPKVVTPAPAVKVTVFKTNGDKISGLFVSGDTEKIVVQSAGNTVSINLSEISGLNFGDAPKTVLGNVNFSFGNFDAANNVNPSGISNPVGTVPGGVVNGKASTLPKPEYPAAARAVHASGAVSVQVLIDENGDVISAEAVSGHPLLRTAAVEAAKQAKFAPTVLSGQPVKVSGIITYNFVP